MDFTWVWRWLHYVAGVMWIGHLWFFNFVNLNLQGDASYPPEMKKVVNPLLMTRALFMFRWGAMFTFLTGLVLLGLIHGLDFSKTAGSDRALFMMMGAAFGTIMWFNVWFIIWPAQKKIIGAAQGGPAVDPALPKKAAMASRINTYLSVPMLIGMLGGAHGEYQIFGGGVVGLCIAVAVGLALVKLGYLFAPKVSTKLFTPQA